MKYKKLYENFQGFIKEQTNPFIQEAQEVIKFVQSLGYEVANDDIDEDFASLVFQKSDGINDR